MSKPDKIVVFDLDETLGCFVELGMFCDALSSYLKHQLSDNEFNEVLDIFPEFLRPNIINILKYLMSQRNNGKCRKIMIYTNNQGPREWCERISKYFDIKTGGKIFDKIIAAFKVKGEIIEIGRTSHNKSVSDLIRCANLPENTEICFLDDQYHRLMEEEKVFYINVKPYIFNMPYNEMASRYLKKGKLNVNSDEFINFINTHMSKYKFTVINKRSEDKDIDLIISKQIMIYLEEFFNKNGKNKTRRKRNIKNKTKRSK